MPMPRFQEMQQPTVVPPFQFSGMKTYVFPLRANAYRLQQFCDKYLNIIPPEIGYFRAAMPYVQLMLVDYGQMALSAANAGWLSQQEVMFAVGIEWYQKQNDKMVFKGWAWVTPFIFVDNEVSLALGRSVWGWPKALARVIENHSSFSALDGTIPVTRLATQVYSNLYTGSSQGLKTFLEIERNSLPEYMQANIPVNNVSSPWMLIPNMASAISGMNQDWRGWMRTLGFIPHISEATPANFWAMLKNTANTMNPFTGQIVFNSLNLKQFRAMNSTVNYCYQSLTCAEMKVTAFNRGGLLGEVGMMNANPSGAMKILLHRWPSLPIVETLGLTVSRQWKDGDVQVAELEPVFPFWYDVDMNYNLGENLAWRGENTLWHNSSGKVVEQDIQKPMMQEKEEARRLYNTTLGPSQSPISGRIYFPQINTKVLPLLAETEALERYLKEHLQDPMEGGNQRFSLWLGKKEKYAYVYLAISSEEDVTQVSNNIGSYDQQTLSFLLPLLREEKVGDTWVFRDMGWMPVSTFSKNSTAAISRSEVYGIPTIKGSFVQPSNNWMSPLGPGRTDQSLLTVSVDVLPAMATGSEFLQRPVFDIFRPAANLEEDPHIHTWCNVLKDSLLKKTKISQEQTNDISNFRLLFLELLLKQAPMPFYTFKQIRDISNPFRACYQSVNLIPHVMDELFEIKEMDSPTLVRIYDYPSLPIVKRLGLVVRKEELCADGTLSYILDPIRPFWMRFSAHTEMGQCLMNRYGENAWRAYPSASVSMFTPTLPQGFSRFVDEHAPEDLKKLFAMDWPNRPQIPLVNSSMYETEALSQEKAIALIHKISPQLVLETILSRAWQSKAPDTWWIMASLSLSSRDFRLQKSFSTVKDDIEFFTKEIHKSETTINNTKASNSLNVDQVFQHLKSVAEDIVTIMESAKDASSLISLSTITLAKEFCVSDPSYHKHHKEIQEDKDNIEDVLSNLNHYYNYLRKILFTLIVKQQQKPDFCVLRNTAGTFRDQIFPLQQCWKERWYFLSELNTSQDLVE